VSEGPISEGPLGTGPMGAGPLSAGPVGEGPLGDPGEAPPPLSPGAPLLAGGGEHAGAAASSLAVSGQRPEVAVAGAFAGGLVLATILKRLGR
jgi:hypothetical protein